MKAIDRLFMLTLTLLVSCACSAAAESRSTTASLKPAPEQPAAIWPMRQAILFIDNASSRIVNAVKLRSTSGGPTMMFPAVIPPNSSGELTVQLPALASQQVYRVDLLADAEDASSTITQLEAPNDWPAELVTAPAFFDPAAYEQYESQLPAWPEAMKKNLLLAGLLLLGGAAASLLLRRMRVRLVVLAGVVVISWLAMWRLISQEPVLLVREDPDKHLMIVSSRRTTRCVEKLNHVWPVYIAPWQMQNDSTVLRADSMSVTVEPSQIRLFRYPGR